MTLRWETHRPEETLNLGRALAGGLAEGDVVLLQGALGVGKTALVKGVGAGLGVTGEVKSPTFALHLIYAGGRLTLHHIDLYRLKTPAEVQELGLDEVLGREGVCFLEWPERMGTHLPFAVVLGITEGPGAEDRVLEARGPEEVLRRFKDAAGETAVEAR